MQPLPTYLYYFLLACFVVALTTSMIRTRDPRKIIAEASRFFISVVVCLLLFGTLVAVLEWLFVRPLI
jgi:hypothetical protein